MARSCRSTASPRFRCAARSSCCTDKDTSASGMPTRRIHRKRSNSSAVDDAAMPAGPGLHGEADAPFIADSATVAEQFDLANLPPDYYANPYPYYRALRDHAPVKRMPDGSWFLTRYRDILPVYRDPHAWSSDKKREFGPKYGVTPLYEHHTTSL